MSKQNPDTDSIIISAYLPRSLVAKLDAFAVAQDRSRSWLLTHILAEKMGMAEMDEFAEGDPAQKEQPNE